jgi:hypothetical protein
MKYTEYQVWFHAFNNAILAFAQRPNDNDMVNVVGCAEYVANHCLKKFREVEVPEAPDVSGTLGGFDIKSVVEQVAKEAMKGDHGGKKKKP